MNLRSFVVLGGLVAATGAAFGYAASGCSPKPVDTPDSGPACTQTEAGPGQGCPCDPSTFKMKGCYEGPANTLGPGKACRSGMRKCDNGHLSECAGQVLPSEEICDGLDNDCDGVADDFNSGQMVLQDLSEAGLMPPIEAGVECYVNMQTGLCAAGRYQCPGVSGEVKPCQTQSQCDNGLCVGGVCATCTPYVMRDPDGGASPYMEICNTLDDDCDGMIDNVDYMGQTCMVTYEDGGSPKGECANGTMQCIMGADTCVGMAKMNETCNGKDDNCDGKIDNGACAGNANGTWCCNYSTSHFCNSSDIGGSYKCYQ